MRFVNIDIYTSLKDPNFTDKFGDICLMNFNSDPTELEAG